MAPKVGSAIRFRRTVRRKSVAPAGGFGSFASPIPPVDTGGKGSGAPVQGLQFCACARDAITQWDDIPSW